jgi:hypothetical protein
LKEGPYYRFFTQPLFVILGAMTLILSSSALKSALRYTALVCLFSLTALPARAADSTADYNAAAAAANQIIESVDRANQQIVTELRTSNTKFKEAVDGLAKQISATTGEAISNVYTPVIPSAEVEAVDALQKSRVSGESSAKLFETTILGMRHRQLASVPLGQSLDNWYVDPSWALQRALAAGDGEKTSKGGITPGGQLFSILMRFFCNPAGRSGTMVDFKTDINGIGTVKCAGSEGIPGAKPNLVSFDPSEKDFADIVDLPINTPKLFLSTNTYPVAPADAVPVNDGKFIPTTNFNSAAALYFPGIMASLDLMLGLPASPPNLGSLTSGEGQAQYIDQQAKNARQMLATAPFAMMAADRIPTMGSEVAQTLAARLGVALGGARDKNTDDMLARLAGQSGVGRAQYLQIMAYDIPTAPAYLSEIDKMDDAELAREEIKLLGFQTAIQYQINRYMEILNALEAINNTDKRT